MEPSTVSALFTSIKAATDIAKFIKDSNSTLKDAEANLKLAELISAIADVKINAAELREQLAEKNEKILALEKMASIKSELIFEEPAYYKIKDEHRESAFCQPCYDKDEKLIHLQIHGVDKGAFKCHSCGKTFFTVQYKINLRESNLKEAKERAARRERDSWVG